MSFVIEFRSGTYFQNLRSQNGGPLKTAKTFMSRGEADEFMHVNDWIMWDGGMTVQKETFEDESL
jgi:hypothetical protein